MDGYGYPVSVFYGDFLLYIVAVLRIMGFSIVAADKLYVFIINTGTVIVSYICFSKIFKDDRIAGLTTLVYATVGYRTVCIFVRSAVGEYSAMMFLPLIALAVYRVYMSDDDNWTTYKRNAFIMALGMTGLIGSHILSIEMVVVTLVILCGVCWRKTFTKNVLCGYMLAEVDTYVLMRKKYLLNWTDISSLHGKVMEENMRLQMVRIG